MASQKTIDDKNRREVMEVRVLRTIREHGYCSRIKLYTARPVFATRHDVDLALRRLIARGVVFSKYGTGGMYGPKLYGIAHLSHWKVK